MCTLLYPNIASPSIVVVHHTSTREVGGPPFRLQTYYTTYDEMRTYLCFRPYSLIKVLTNVNLITWNHLHVCKIQGLKTSLRLESAQTSKHL